MGITTTPNLGLIKPDGVEPATNWTAQWGSNANTIDTESSIVGTYVPILTATTTNPNLGATGFINGRWHRVGHLVTAWGDTLLDGVGANLGGSSWRMSLPFNADLTIHSDGVLNESSDNIGCAKFRSGVVTQSYNASALLSNIAELIFYPDSSSTSVGGGDLTLPQVRLKWFVTYVMA